MEIWYFFQTCGSAAKTGPRALGAYRLQPTAKARVGVSLWQMAGSGVAWRIDADIWNVARINKEINNSKLF